MRNGFTCVGFIIGVAGLATTSMADGGTTPVFSLKAVKVTDSGGAVTVLPVATNEISAEPGDVIEANVFISDWAKAIPDGIRSYQFKFDGRSSAESGESGITNGTILPVGWRAPLNPTACWQDPNICEPEEFCDGSKCVFPGHNPTEGVSINTGRDDFIFLGLSVVKDILTSILDYTYFAQVSPGWADDAGTLYYAGTIKLVVSDQACGTFTWAFLETADTFLGDRNNVKTLPLVESLVITLDPCGPIPLEFDPPNCTVDAALPHETDNASVEFGLDWFKVRFTTGANTINCADFLISKFPVRDGELPICLNVTSDGDWATIHLNIIIPLEKWTCFMHIDSGQRKCIGNLPADANANGTVEVGDGVGDVIDLALNLKGDYEPGMHIMECDTDRSGACAPPDILAIMDLLNGAEDLGIWEGAMIGSSMLCPTR